METKLIVTEAKAKVYRIDDDKNSYRVCAYCRVSTDKTDQRNSYNSQKKFFESEFKNHPNWVDCRVFADQGISGTSLKKRDEFNLMIALAKGHAYDIIVTKEVSRFSRNIQDLLNIVEDLRKRKVYIWFMAEEINTECDDFRERLIEAGKQAEAESLKTSKRVRWGHRRQIENGAIFGRKEMYGYNIVRDKDGVQRFEIIEDEAKVVKHIFEMYAGSERMGTFKIAKKLENEGIPTKTGNGQWSNTVILRLLRNERYVGDLTTGKTYTPNPLSHEKKYNCGQADKITITGHHEEDAIISRELWDRVQAKLQASALSVEQKEKHSNRYWCSGKVFCGECGQRFVSHIKHLKSGATYKCWKCWDGQQRGRKKSITLENGQSIEVGCSSESVNDATLKQAAYDLIKEFIKPNIDSICSTLEKAFEAEQVRPRGNHAKEIAGLEEIVKKINTTLVNLTIKYANQEIPKEMYTLAQEQQKTELLALQARIRELSQEAGDFANLSTLHEHKITALRSLISLKDSDFNEDLFSRLIDKIVVKNGHILEYYFYALPKPVRMSYTTHGRLENFVAEFTILDDKKEKNQS